VGNRLSKITTRTGDDGTTGLGDGSRVDKTDPRIEAIGGVDELNSWLGLLLTQDLPDELRPLLVDIQHDLFDLGGELSIPGHTMITAEQVQRLEQAMHELTAQLPPLKEFILPGGNPAAAVCHIARTVCRRAERQVWVLMPGDDAEKPLTGMYLNRLSDLLFSLARLLARMHGGSEVLWSRKRGAQA
jgi:cob(I)alamin adenosyltransferase